MAKRVMITGISSFLGARVASALEDQGDIEYIMGVGLSAPPLDLSRTEFVKADIRSPLIHRIVSSNEIDTIVHADLTSSPVRVGGRSAQKERNVIGTMQLLGAAQRTDTVKKVVFRSSTAAYGNEPNDPSVLPESWFGRSVPDHGYSKDVYEAETFARDFGRRRPDVCLTILRMANVIGPTAETNMTQFFSLPFVPTALGFDPRLQLLHEEDAVEVMTRAVIEDHPGVFNVAPDGVVYLSQAIRIARRLPLPIIAPLAVVIGDALRRLGLIDFSSDQVNLIVHGRVVDNTRLKEVFGFTPSFTTLQSLVAFTSSARQTVGPSAIGDWERELYGLVAGLGSSGRNLPDLRTLSKERPA